MVVCTQQAVQFEATCAAYSGWHRHAGGMRSGRSAGPDCGSRRQLHMRRGSMHAQCRQPIEVINIDLAPAPGTCAAVDALLHLPS